MCKLDRIIVFPGETAEGRNNLKVCPPCLMFFCLEMAEVDNKTMDPQEYKVNSINVQNRFKRMLGL